MSRAQSSVPAKSKALSTPVPVITHTREPSVTGDGDVSSHTGAPVAKARVKPRKAAGIPDFVAPELCVPEVPFEPLHEPVEALRRRLEEVARLLEIQGANVHRVRAWRASAR